MKQFSSALGFLKQWDALIASLALLGMVLIPVIEVLLRPIQVIQNDVAMAPS